jgi:hypothetical protein
VGIWCRYITPAVSGGQTTLAGTKIYVAIGLTPTGRATVERLQLNREGVVNLRRVLRTIGQHPPMDSDQV